MADRLERVFDKVTSAPAPDLWPDIATRVSSDEDVSALTAERPRRSWRAGVSIAAVLVILAAVGIAALQDGSGRVATKGPTSTLGATETTPSVTTVPHLVAVRVPRGALPTGLALHATDSIDTGTGATITTETYFDPAESGPARRSVKVSQIGPVIMQDELHLLDPTGSHRTTIQGLPTVVTTGQPYVVVTLGLDASTVIQIVARNLSEREVLSLASQLELSDP